MITKGKIYRKKITVEKQRFWNWKETSLEGFKWYNRPFSFSSLCTFNVFGKTVFALQNQSGITIVCDTISNQQTKYINIITLGYDNESFDKSFSFFCEFENAPEEAEKYFFFADEIYNPGSKLTLYKIDGGQKEIIRVDELIVGDGFHRYRSLKFDSPKRYSYGFYVRTPLLNSKIVKLRQSDPFSLYPKTEDYLELQTGRQKISVPVRITSHSMFNEDTFQRLTCQRYWYECPEVVMREAEAVTDTKVPK